MTKKRSIKGYITALKEISHIMAAMRNLSLIEINKMTRFLATQEQVIKTMEVVYADFLSFYPQFKPPLQLAESGIYILIGSERGFCGNFNDELISQFKTKIQKQLIAPKLIIIGRKLAMKFVDNPLVLTSIDGPSASEEIPSTISTLTQTLEKLQKTDGATSFGNFAIIYNSIINNRLQSSTLLPFEKLSLENKHAFPYPPILNLSPQVFMSQFMDQYLFAILYLIIYQSFFTENNQRFHHTDTTIQKLDKQIENLTHHLNVLRQEEITEEIEIILLSAEALINEFPQRIV